jgi:sugar lactone lactonase YvrE
MTSANGKLYTVNANGGQLVELTPGSSTFRQVVDISASLGHVVPDAITYHNGNFYVGEEGTFDPGALNTENILKITPDGTISTYASGFNKLANLAFDSAGNLYALELFTGTAAPGPSAIGTGEVVKVVPGGTPQPVVTNLTFPTGMTFAPDGSLYISNVGFAIPNSGQILKAKLG